MSDSDDPEFEDKQLQHPIEMSSVTSSGQNMSDSDDPEHD